MSEITPNLRLPYLQSAQAQKHVTHNEAIRALDALVQMSVASRTATSPPPAPPDGVRYIVPGGAAGAWSGFAPHIAAFQDGAWVKYAAREGWLVWVEDEDRLYAFDGSAWITAGGNLNPAPLVGINATADATNRLAVSAPATLFSHAGSDHRHKINKAGAAHTASLLYQTGFSGRAEIGLAGDDDLHVKVSPDGAQWKEALVIDRSTGAARFPCTALTAGFPSPWAGKTWAALGTSITQGGLYTGPLASLLGASLVNLGVSGGRLAALAAGGGLEIQSKVANIPPDAHLVTLEAGINDFRSSVPLGASGDTATSTFYGALHKAGSDILSANPARILAYLTPYATNESSAPDADTPNANGNTLMQFQQAVRDVARRLGCPVIDIGAESGIAPATAAIYLSDGLHPSIAGGVRMAELIYDRLLFVRPARDVVARPVFSPASGAYATAQTVSIACATPGAAIFFTTDGTAPTIASTPYSAPFAVSSTTTLKAFAVKPGLLDSPVATALLTIGAAPFSPASLSPALWYDASDLGTLFQDAAASTPVAGDGNPVGTIRDKSGNDRHLTQATPALRPLYKSDGTRRWFAFDGTQKALLSARYSTPSGNFAIAWASRKDVWSANDTMKSVIAGVDSGQTWVGDNAGGSTSPSIEFRRSSGTQQIGGGFDAASIHSDHVSVINVTAGALQTYQDGVAGATATDAQTISIDGLTFAIADYLYAGRVYEFMIIPRALSAAEISDLTNWLKAKAGL